MEVDERLRWLETRISSSLRPRGEDLRVLFAEEENRSAFLNFCNNSEARHLFIHVPSKGGGGGLHVSSFPPKSIADKALFFLKCSHASKLSKESITEDVVYSECSELPLEHLELVVREVYLPLVAVPGSLPHGVAGDKLLDVLHRLINSLQVTSGFQIGRLVLPLPSLQVLAEAAMNGVSRRSVVVHILESCVVAWMKQVKMAMHFDPQAVILKRHGKQAGPMAEIEFWTGRLDKLLSVREQLGSLEVLNILHSLDQAHSTYSQAFIHVHRDIGKAIVDTELCLMYVNTLKPWCLQLHGAFSPDTLIKLFPPLLTTIALVWQHSGVYSMQRHFHRLLRLVANEVASKARDIVGEDPLDDPDGAVANLRLALRVCASFRGCYLDQKEKASTVGNKQLQTGAEPYASLLQPNTLTANSKAQTENNMANFTFPSSSSPSSLCRWPARNSPVFASLNATMERCNDILELVQTILHFSELSTVASQSSSENSDPVMCDIDAHFHQALCQFRAATQNLLSLEPGEFERSFFVFRSTVKDLERQLSSILLELFEQCSSLPAKMLLLESFQGLMSRENIQAVLQKQLDSIVDELLADISTVHQSLPSLISQPPTLTNIPPVATTLLWVCASRERVDVPMERLRKAAPQLLEGDKGFTLRHSLGELRKDFEKQFSSIVGKWERYIPQGTEEKLKCDVLVVQDGSGLLSVNFDLSLEQVLREAHYLSRPPIRIALPPTVRSLQQSVDTISLHHHTATLQICAHHYNNLQQSLDPVYRSVFQHKLQLLENLLSQGLNSITWCSPDLADYLAQLRSLLLSDLLPSVDTLLSHTKAMTDIVSSWATHDWLDMFAATTTPDKETDSEKKEKEEEEEKGEGLQKLKERHSKLLESIERMLSLSMKHIYRHIELAAKSVDVSRESPSWCSYLSYLDSVVEKGLKELLLQVMSTLSHRAHQYEQGGSIPPLVSVSLVLYSKEMRFLPPLSTHSTMESVPEVVRSLLEGTLGVMKTVNRLEPTKQKESYFTTLQHNSDIRSAIHKITAHVETSARQCQSLRKRFSMYAFLWEEDILTTFDDFLRGVAQPHPRKFTRPETVRSRSASHSATTRPHSHSTPPSNAIGPPSQTASSVMESVAGITDWNFLRTGDEEEEESSRTAISGQERARSRLGEGRAVSKRPSLEDFDGEIAVFQGILQRLEVTREQTDVGWVCVDQRPARVTLTSLVNKWTHVYASYLESRVVTVLRELETFFDVVEPQVEAITGEESDTAQFEKLVAIFNKVNQQQVEMDHKFGAVHRAVTILDKFNYPLSPQTRQQFEAAPQRWTTLRKRVSLGKQRISPQLQKHSALILKDLQLFGEKASNLYRSFLTSSCLTHRCGHQEADAMIEEYVTQFRELQDQASDLRELQELLELCVFNFGLLNEFEEALNALKQLREYADVIHEEHSHWLTQCWVSVDTGAVLQTTQHHQDLLATLHQCSESWDLRIEVEGTIREAQLLLPVIDGMCSSSMRPRHWKQVLRYCPSPALQASVMRSGVVDIEQLQQLSVKRLKEFQLHFYCEEVLGVVEKADREVAIEQLLRTTEEVWLSKQFQLRRHTRNTLQHHQSTELTLGLDITSLDRGGPSSLSTSSIRRQSRVTSAHVSPTPQPLKSSNAVRLLFNTEELFEALNHYQTSLQGVMGTAAASSFADELQRWHKQLQTVEAVLQVWEGVQELWIQLEDFYGSSEVAQHLSTPHFIFTTVDKEWKELMTATVKNRSVLSTCLQEDLLSKLEKCRGNLHQCQSALLTYMEGRRRKCSWFNFLSLEDILKFVCYGSNIASLNDNISKLLPHSQSLVFSNSPATSFSSRRESIASSTSSVYIVGVVSRAGENLELCEAVCCQGLVEAVLNDLLHKVSQSLQTQFSTLVAKHVLPVVNHDAEATDSFSFLHGLSSIWSSNAASQVSVLVTQVALDLAMQKAMGSGDRRQHHLEALQTVIGELVETACEVMRGNKSSSWTSHTAIPNTAVATIAEANESFNASSTLMDMADGNSTLLHRSSRTMKPQKMLHLQNVLNVLLAASSKVKQLISTLSNANSFTWQASLHFSLSQLSDQHSCILTTLTGSLPYGFCYTGSMSSGLSLSPVMEKGYVYLLQLMRKHHFCVESKQGQNAQSSSVLADLAVLSGRTLFTLPCSEVTSHYTLVNCVKGMVSTGAWLCLPDLTSLAPLLIQRFANLLAEVHNAWKGNSSTVEVMRESLSLAPDLFCMATVSSNQAYQSLPTTLLSIFKSFSRPGSNLDYDICIEASLLANGFTNASQLLSALLSACELKSSSHTPIGSPSISLREALAVVSQAGKYLKVFKQVSSSKPEDPGSEDSEEAIEPPLSSLVQCLLSEQVVHHDESYAMFTASRVGRSSFSQHSHEQSEGRIVEESESEVPTDHATANLRDSSEDLSTEELCLALSLVEHIFSPRSQRDINGLLDRLSKAFTHIDIGSILTRWSNIRQDLAQRSSSGSAAVMSAQESRAASVLQTDSDRDRESVFPSLEEAIVQACLLKELLPTASFQQAVHSLFSLVLRHPLVAVNGPSYSGKTSCVEATVETLRLLGYAVHTRALSVGALGPDQLSGYFSEDGFWKEGILLKLLCQTSCLQGSNSLLLIVLDGPLSPLHLSTLLPLAMGEYVLRMPNMGAVTINKRVRIVMSNTESCDGCLIPTTSLSPATLSWEMLAHSGLLSLPSPLQEDVLSLMKKHIPALLLLFAPLLTNHQQQKEEGQLQLVPQGETYSETQLVGALCRVLKCVLETATQQDHSLPAATSTTTTITVSTSSSAPMLHHNLLYSIAWSFGAVLNTRNKITLEKWLREHFKASLDAAEDSQVSLWEHSMTSAQPSVDTQATGASGEFWPYVLTSKTRVLAQLVKMLMTRGVPVVLDGPTGSGKTSFLLNTLRSYCASTGAERGWVHLYMDRGMTSAGLWSEVKEKIKWHSGTNYTPADCQQLVCLIEDLHLTQVTSKQPSSGVCDLLHHHISTGVVCDPSSSQEHHVSGVCYLLSTDTRQAPLPRDLMGSCIVIKWEQFSDSDLVDIFSFIAKKHFLQQDSTPSTKKTNKRRSDGSSDPISSDVVDSLVCSAVRVHSQLCDLFLATTGRTHYTYTMTTISTVLKQLCLSLSADNSQHDLLVEWLRLSQWMYAGAMSSVVDRERYRECVVSTLRKYFSDSKLLPLLLREDAMVLPADQVSSLQEKLTSVIKNHNATNPTLFIHFYPSSVKLVARIIHLLSLPHDISSALLVGVQGAEKMAHLVAVSSGCTLVRPSQLHCSTYSTDGRGKSAASKKQLYFNPVDFESAMKNIYTIAGVKNERLLLFIDSTELQYKSNTDCVYRLIKDCAITSEFTMEERSKVINAVRSDVCNSGVAFNQHSAWEFFLKRVKCNLRCVISLRQPSASLALTSTSSFSSTSIISEPWRELVAVTNTYYQLHWERKHLVEVASQHLARSAALSEGQKERTAHLLSSVHLTLRDAPFPSSLAPPDVITYSNSAFEYFVELFAHLLEEREKEAEEQRQQLLVCLGRVEAEEERVRCLEEKLKREKVLMEEKGNAYSQLLVQVGQDNAIAKEQKKLVNKQEERIDHLQKVLPEYDHLYMLYIEEMDRIVLKTNNIALGLDTYGLTELRSLSKPPAELQELMEAVIIITKSTTADLSWTKGAKRLMANLDRFKELLLDFTEGEVDSNSLLEVLAGYTSRSSFTEDNLAVAVVSVMSGMSNSVSSAGGEAAARLCKWVKGVESYHRLVQENVTRLHLRVREVNSSLHEYTEKLLQLQHKLQVIVDRLEGLNESLEQASVDCGQQSKLVSTMDRELQHANKFLQALSVARVQWSRQLSALDSAVFNQLGVLTLAAAYTSYLIAVPPTITLSIVNSHLLPCIADKGFTVDIKAKLSTGLFSPPTLSSFSSSLNNTSRKSSDSTALAPPPPPPSTASTPHLPLGPLDADHLSIDSTEELAHCLLAVFSSNAMKANHVFSSRNVYGLLHLAVVSRAWNKWSLVYDYEETAVEHIKQHWEQQFADKEIEKRPIQIIDARDSSSAFLQTIEQCLVNGAHLLLTHLPFPLNPALLPVLALGQYRHRTGQLSPSIQFCGRRLHVHSNFMLTLTTSSLPSNVEEWGKLASSTQLVIFSPTFTLGRELLFHSSCFSLFDSKAYLDLCSKIKKGREKLKEVEKAVTSCLQKSSEEKEVSLAASEIEKLIGEKDEVIQVNTSLQDQFRSLSNLHNAVQPLISFAAAAFVFLQELFSELCPTKSPQWHTHQRQVESVLHGRVKTLRKSMEDKFEKETAESEPDQALSSYEKESEEFKRELMDRILVDLARSIDHRYLPLTATCLYLLSRADLTQATPLCTQQLLYLAQDTHPDSKTSLIQLPQFPDYVSTEVISRLYSAPLHDASQLEAMRETMFTNNGDWERFLSGESDVPLPWKIQNERGLDNLVIFKALSPEKWNSLLGSEVSSLISKVCSGLPLLVDVLEKRQGNADSKSSEAILLMYEDCNLLSQYNTMYLESTIAEHFKDAQKRLLVTHMSAGTEGKADEILTSANSKKCVLVTDIHLAPPSWFLTIPSKIQLATDKGTTLLLTQSPHHSIPNDFHLYPVYKFSQLAPTTAVAQKLPQICPASFSPIKREKILSSISLLLLLTPASLLEDLQSIPRSLHYLVPSLCTIHGLLTSSTHLPHFSNLLFCFNYLISLTKDEHLTAVENKDDCIKHTLMALASQIYPLLQKDIADRICSYSGEDSVLHVSEDLSIPLPDNSVSLHQYSDYFIDRLSPSSSSDKLRLGPAWDVMALLLARTLSNVSIVKE